MSVFQYINMIPADTVAAYLGLELKKGRGECPVNHGSKSGKPFGINRKYNNFHCFHCNQSWSNLDIYMLVRNVPVAVAASEMCAAFGIADTRSTGLNNGRVPDDIPEGIENNIILQDMSRRRQMYRDGRRQVDETIFSFEVGLSRLRLGIDGNVIYDLTFREMVWGLIEEIFGWLDKLRSEELRWWDDQLEIIDKRIKGFINLTRF